MSVAPLTANTVAFKPVKPERTPVALMVKPLPLPTLWYVSVPEPDNVPFKVSGEEFTLPFTMVGLFPSCSTQLVPIVIPALPVLLIVTLVKVLPLQVSV